MMTSNLAIPYELGLAYLGVHTLIYVVLRMMKRGFTSERRVLRYHLVSAVFLAIVVFVFAAVVRSYQAFAVAVGLVALHGIYSITFLELWSLTQGSYSIQILRKVRSAGTLPIASAIVQLSSIGEGKGQERLNALVNLGLVRQEGTELIATPRGRLAAYGLRILLFLANYKTSG